MAAALKAIGRVVVPAPGTPVFLPVPPDINPPAVHAVLISVLQTNSGNVYIGLVNMNKDPAVLFNVLQVLPIPTATSIPTFSIAVIQGANAIRLPDFWFDADVPGDGVLVSGLVA